MESIILALVIVGGVVMAVRMVVQAVVQDAENTRKHQEDRNAR